MTVHALLAHGTARTAGDARDQHAVAGLEGADGVAAFFDDTDALMADGGAFVARRHVALQDVQVGAADGGVDDLDDGVGRLLDGRLGLVLELDGVLTAVDEGFHGGCLCLAGGRCWAVSKY